MSDSLAERCHALLVELGVILPSQSVRAEPLSGGVASDIARVMDETQTYCIKFALPKLKVAADWFAPLHRNAAEYAWLEVVASIAPECSVRLFGRSKTQHGFAMEYLDGDDVYLWKTELLAEADDRGEAGAVGDVLGRVHAASAKADFDTGPFDNRDDFRALRIEPYISYTALQHEGVARQLNDLAERLYQSHQVLVHGDVSPKNILFRDSGPVLLDAECATMGDASFDPAFCLNHLVLKAVHLPGSRQRYLVNSLDFWHAYQNHISWTDPKKLEADICQLLPALMLGRVDGKSPVEYLNEVSQATVRQIALQRISEPVTTLQELIADIGTYLKEVQA